MDTAGSHLKCVACSCPDSFGRITITLEKDDVHLCDQCEFLADVGSAGLIDGIFQRHAHKPTIVCFRRQSSTYGKEHNWDHLQWDTDDLWGNEFSLFCLPGIISYIRVAYNVLWSASFKG
jgi:hypothetical protein